MGICIDYYAIDDEKINELKSWLSSGDDSILQKVFNELRSLQDDESYLNSYYLDLEKLWDGLHFLLTGFTSNDTDKTIKTPAQNAIYDGCFGQVHLHDKGVSFNDKHCIRDIVQALNEINIDELLAKVDFDKFSEASLYPDIWFNDDKEYLVEDLRICFENFKQFYQNVFKNNLSVLVVLWY